MKKILFVDDEPNILSGLKRLLRGMRNEWKMSFAESGKEALKILEQGDFDVIVSDVRMPGMDGVELLTKVKDEYPKLSRIILSGHSDYTSALASTRVAHQYLAKPTDSHTLKDAIERDAALKELLSNNVLQTIVSDRDALPTPPQLYLDLMKEVQSPDGSMNKIAALIEQDISVTAKVLQLVNSAFFGLPRNITKIMEAVTYLGVDTIRGLLLMNEVFSSFDNSKTNFDIDGLQQHSMRVAVLAKKLAKHENMDRKEQELAYLAGMLHDIGYLIMATAMPEQVTSIKDIQEDNKPTWQAELEVIGCTHAELGGYLLGLWGLPNVLVESVAHHHQLARYPGRELNLVVIVHLADALVHANEGNKGEQLDGLLDMDFLGTLGVSDKLEEWKKLADEQQDE